MIRTKTGQRGATLVEMMLVVSLLGVGSLLAFTEKQAEIEQQKAMLVGLQLSQYNNAIRNYIAKNDGISTMQRAGSTWLKNTSCGGPYAIGSEFLPCDFPSGTVANPIPFGMLTLNTSIEVTGAGDARRVSATTTTGEFYVPEGGALKARADLSGIAALTAASATQTGYQVGAGGGLTPYGAATDASYKSNPLDSRITMVAANKAENDVWLRTDGGNQMHAPLRFDSTDPLNRTIVGASRMQNFAGEVLYLGAPSGMSPATAASVIMDADTEILGSIRIRGNSTTDGSVAAGGNITSQAAVAATGNIASQSSVSANGSVSAGGNVTTSGHVLAGQSVQAQLFYDSNNTAFYVDPASTSVVNAVQSNSITNMGTVESKGRLYAQEYVALGAIATEGTGCSPNGLMGRDSTGKTLSCQNGVWASNGGSTPTCQTFNVRGYGSPDVTNSPACPAGWLKMGWDTTGKDWRQSVTPGIIIGENDYAAVFCCKF